MSILKDNKGVTLIEILIVIAIIAIIGAIVIPNFLGGTDRARLRSDLQSTQVIRSAMDLYQVENGAAPSGINADDIFARLYEERYLTTRLESGDTQTSGLTWILDNGLIFLQVSSDFPSSLISGLSPQDLSLIQGLPN